MTGTPRSRTLWLALGLLILVLAALPPIAAVAQKPAPTGNPPGVGGPTPSGPGPGTGPGTGSGPGSDPPTTPGPTPAPTNTRRPSTGPGDLPGDPTKGTATPTPTLTHAELIKALAPNRIIFHAATPIQLCKAGDGLQIYFISRKGKTLLGPWIPSFAELQEKHPEGEEASIYFGFNPFTGKKVKIDYLPHVNRIRVDTFYADREHDKNKQYIFHFGPEHDITYDAW